MAIIVQDTKLKPGYKLTEVGVIPEDWRVSTVGAEFEIQLGKMLDSEKNRGILKPYLGNKAVQWNHIDISNLQMMAMSRSDLERFRLQYGDLLVCEGGEVGRAAIWEAPLEECYYQKALHRLRSLHGFNSHLMLAFLHYWTDYGKLANYISQTSIAHLTREKLVEVPILVPPLNEQHAISTALSDIDSLLTSLDKLITKKRDIKQATMQQLLTGKKRLPGFSKGMQQAYKQSSFGMIPMDWELMPLGLLSAFITKGATPTTYGFGWARDGVLFLRSECVSEQGIDLAQSMFITPEAHNILRRGEVREEDILITITGNVGRVIYLNNGFGIANINQHIARIRILDANVDAGYVFYFLSHPMVRKYYNSIVTGQAYPQISLKQVRDTKIPIPPTKSEQQAIATILSDMDAEISALEQRREKTRALKQAMMQELLTGKTRLLHEYDRAEGTRYTESGDPALQETGVQVSGELGRAPEQSQYRAESTPDPLSQAAGL